MIIKKVLFLLVVINMAFNVQRCDRVNDNGSSINNKSNNDEIENHLKIIFANQLKKQCNFWKVLDKNNKIIRLDPKVIKDKFKQNLSDMRKILGVIDDLVQIKSSYLIKKYSLINKKIDDIYAFEELSESRKLSKTPIFHLTSGDNSIGNGASGNDSLNKYDHCLDYDFKKVLEPFRKGVDFQVSIEYLLDAAFDLCKNILKDFTDANGVVSFDPYFLSNDIENSYKLDNSINHLNHKFVNISNDLFFKNKPSIVEPNNNNNKDKKDYNNNLGKILIGAGSIAILSSGATAVVMKDNRRR